MSRKKGSSKKSKVTLESKSTGLDFRYGQNWDKISTKARELCPLCCFCLVKPATLTHHVEYIKMLVDGDKSPNALYELLLDNVVLGKHIFPLCEECHRKVHANKNYIKDKRGKQFDRNTDVIINKLEFGYMVVAVNK